jgi:uncharacterized protein (TIGR02996 family)
MNQAFLRAIRDTPEDAHRLVYADWLDEQGDAERAEFIRLQCRLARTAPDDPQHDALEERERALLTAHEAKWLGPLPPEVRDWSFRGGLVDALLMRDSAGVEGLAEVFERHPVRKVTFAGRPPTIDALAAADFLGSVAHLSVEGLRDVNLVRLAESPHLAGLTELALDGPAVDNDLARSLASAAATRQLKALRLGETSLTDAGVRTLVHGHCLAGLTELQVRGRRVSDGGFAAMTARDQAMRWTALTLSAGRGLSADQVARLEACANLRGLVLTSLYRPLARFPVLRRLTRLAAVGVVGVVRALASSACLHSLHGLWVGGDLELGSDEGLEALSDVLAGLRAPALHLKGERVGLAVSPALLVERCGALGRLAGLQFSEAHLRDADLRALGSCPDLTGLADLDIGGPLHGGESSLTDAGLAELLRSPALVRLAQLRLSGVRALGPAAVRTLTESPHLRRLRDLTLVGPYDGARLDAACLAALAAWPGLARLDRLELGLSPDSEGEDLRPLADSPHLSPLTRLTVSGPTLAPALADAFRQRLGRRFEGRTP